MRRLLYLPDGQVFDVELRVEEGNISAIAYGRADGGAFAGEPVADTDGATFDEAETRLYKILMDRYYA